MPFPSPSEKQARVIWFALTGLAIAAIVLLIVGLVWGLGQALQVLSPVIWPLAVAGVIAYLLDPVVDWLERKGLSRARAIICVFIVALLILGGIFGSVVPQIVRETSQLVERVPAYTTRLQERIVFWVNHPPPLLQKLLKREATQLEPTDASGSGGSTTNTVAAETTNDVAGPPSNPAPSRPALDDKTMQSAASWLAKVAPSIGQWLFGQVGRLAGWFGFLAGLALIPVYAFYLLLEKRGIEASWTDYLPVKDSRFKDELVFVLRSINGYLIAFFRGQVLVALCDAILYTSGFLIIGLPYALLLGAAAVLLTMIPFLGAITICLTALVLALVQYGDWLHPLLVLGVFAVVQSIEGLFISPRIMGGRVGLHPLAIIIAVMAGTTLLGGLLGGILAIPLAAVLLVLMARYVWKKRET